MCSFRDEDRMKDMVPGGIAQVGTLTGSQGGEGRNCEVINELNVYYRTYTE
jgi:hypothetical protein